MKKYIINIMIYLFLLHPTNCLEAPPINIPDQGIIVGTYLKMFRSQNIKAYLGIQYAEASRFSPPEINEIPKIGITNATVIPPDCWQKPFKSNNKESNLIIRLLSGKIKYRDNIQQKFDENCLHLNIFVPDGLSGINRYAVVVWIHSGDFSHGSSMDMDPFQLVFKQKVIVVTVSYRLNIFGFLSTDDGEAQGNFGLMDQSAALFWIRKYINYFGGDENKITIMGHSAGAISVGLHLTSGEWSKNAFTKAIIMSGNPLMENSVRSPKEYSDVLDSIANMFGCIRKPTSLFIQCLKRVDAHIISENIPSVKWGPVVDYGLSNISLPFIENFPIQLFKKGYFQKVPILMGVTDMEDVFDFFNTEKKYKIDDFNNLLTDIAHQDINSVRKSYSDDILCTNVDIVLDALNYIYQNQSDLSDEIKVQKNFINFYTNRTHISPLHLMAELISKDTNVFVYIFKIKPMTRFYELPSWVSVPKLFDQIFIWGVPYMENKEIVQLWNSSDKKITDIVMTLFANFMKTSNPTISNVYLKWSAYQTESQNILEINENFNLKSFKFNYITNFWNSYYPKILRFAVECCNISDTSVTIFCSAYAICTIMLSLFNIFYYNY